MLSLPLHLLVLLFCAVPTMYASLYQQQLSGLAEALRMRATSTARLKSGHAQVERVVFRASFATHSASSDRSRVLWHGVV